MCANSMGFQLRLADFSNFLICNGLGNFYDYFLATWVQSAHFYWRIFDTVAGVGNTNNALESFNSHFKSMFLNNKKYPLDLLLEVICWIIRYYSLKDMSFETTFKPEAKHKKRAQALNTVNAVIGNCYYPNPYRVTANDDGTYTWTKGFPLPNNLHRSYTVFISQEGNDICTCRQFLKYSYCKHLLATLDRFGLTSKRLGRGKFANHTNRKRGRAGRNAPALTVDMDPTPMQVAITQANVPTSVVSMETKAQFPEWCVDGSDGSECESD